MSTMKLEVCVDTLESARNAIDGGADELEVCSAIMEGGLTPAPGLVKEILKLGSPVINLLIKCRGGSDFIYTEEEMTTMLSDIDFYKEMGVNTFVFGALTDAQEIDKVNCARVIKQAHPLPVTFHTAYDLCKEPTRGVEDIIELGFNRLLSCGPDSTGWDEAVPILKNLFDKYGDKIEIMPGAGINPDNVSMYSQAGFRMIHSGCKTMRRLPKLRGLELGKNELFETDVDLVKKLKSSLNIM